MVSWYEGGGGFPKEADGVMVREGVMVATVAGMMACWQLATGGTGRAGGG